MVMAKKVRVGDLRAMGEEELVERLEDLKKALAKERALISSGTRPENPGIIRKNKRDIARVLTVVNERESKKKAGVSKTK